jgi:hypothetical protein
MILLLNVHCILNFLNTSASFRDFCAPSYITYNPESAHARYVPMGVV